jgi:hypothetical protein
MAYKSIEGYKTLVCGPFGVAETNTTFVVCPIPAETFIPPYGVVVDVRTLLDGGTPSIDIGDADDADIWVDTTNITETTVGTYAGTAAAGATQAPTGRYYSAANSIKCVLATGLTAGVFYVYVTMLDVADVS